MPLEAVDTPRRCSSTWTLSRPQPPAHGRGLSASAGVRLRPHAKTHKSPLIARRQMALGAVGICCQKVSEAEIMVHGGVEDVLLSNEVVGPSKVARLGGPGPAGAHRGVCRRPLQPGAVRRGRAGVRGGIGRTGGIECRGRPLRAGTGRTGPAPGPPGRGHPGASLRGAPGLPRQRPTPAHARGAARGHPVRPGTHRGHPQSS